MKSISICIAVILMLAVTSCGNADKAKEIEKINSTPVENLEDGNLSAACKKDLKAFSKYLDGAKTYIQKQKDGTKTTKAEKEKWSNKSRNILKEMGASSTSFTDPKCAIAFSKLQGEFVKVVSDIAKSPI